MDLIATPVGMLTMLTMSAAIVVFTFQTPLGAMSLPTMMMLIAMINFFIMPALALSKGDIASARASPARFS